MPETHSCLADETLRVRPQVVRERAAASSGDVVVHFDVVVVVWPQPHTHELTAQTNTQTLAHLIPPIPK